MRPHRPRSEPRPGMTMTEHSILDPSRTVSASQTPSEPRGLRRPVRVDLAAAAAPPVESGGGLAGRMSSSAVTQIAAVLGERAGSAPVRRLFEAAGLARYLATGPTAMVDEREVSALHRALRQQLGPACARAVARAAGRRTADHLLVRHVPEPIRRLLRHLPRPVVARLLLLVVERDACRLAGSGAFVAVYGRPIRLGLTHNPLCGPSHTGEPICDFLTGTFEHLFRSLLSPDASVREVACAATGAPACIFEIEP